MVAKDLCVHKNINEYGILRYAQNDDGGRIFVFGRSVDKMKTILIPISNSFFIRNFLRTDAFEILKQNQDIRLVLLAPEEKIAYYKREYPYDNLVFDILPDLMKLRLERFFDFLERASIHTRSTTIMQYSAFLRRGGERRAILRLPAFLLGRLLWFKGQFRISRSFLRAIYFWIPTSVFRDIFNKYQPDLIFSPLMLRGETLLIKEAKKLGIKTLGMIHSWDNLYTKSFIRAHPDYLITHTDMICDQAVHLGDYPRERIMVTGIPQYDSHFKRQGIKPREDFIKEIGGDPAKKLILFAFSGKAGIHIDLDMVDILYKLIEKGDLREKVNVLIRPYPKWDAPEARLVRYKEKYGFLAEGAMAHIGSRKENWEFDDKSLDLLQNSLAHADIVINMFSTFFVEASIFDKPLVGIAFDGYQKVNYWNSARRFFDWDHLADLKPLGGILFVNSEKELANAINRYLDNPQYLKEGREAIVKQQCQFTDGKSGERVARTILKILRGQTVRKLEKSWFRHSEPFGCGSG